ncbi:D-alanine--D-alanine ligase family protein [Brooklawnia cerclae]|uniref:D-alanine--D-alanine ligase n=1 Tax=Brooklawnia cerclae TaxID=349934 RepID=A0ABX0SG97_9ACTN|nr:D-alanine--D-alanine ligase family protein [Brooklawnia cerclae]NIH57001.1 D-alanine-D-alanine ligase [Brooklawnia cerclae]
MAESASNGTSSGGAPGRTRVALVFGGQSTEHEISCLTAACVAGAIDTDRFEVHGIGIAKSGTWHRMELADVEALRTDDGTLPALGDDAPCAALIRRPDGVVMAGVEDDRLVDPVGVDVALVLLHGAYGEDGTIQGQFEMLGLPYVGSGVAASAVGMDKHLMKVALAAAGMPIGPYEVLLPGQWVSDPVACCDRVAARLRFPVFVKPARGGSSVGIVRVTDPSGLADAIAYAHRFDPKVVVEEGFVKAREVECAVLGPRERAGLPRTSRPGEIVVHTDDAFYDYEAKYLPKSGEVDLRVPAELDEAVEARVRELAAGSFEAIGAEGLARVDTFVTADGEVVVNEVNTMPGFTQLSMFPSLWQASGIDYRSLITDLLDQALGREVGVIR